MSGWHQALWSGNGHPSGHNRDSPWKRTSSGETTFRPCFFPTDRKRASSVQNCPGITSCYHDNRWVLEVEEMERITVVMEVTSVTTCQRAAMTLCWVGLGWFPKKLVGKNARNFHKVTEKYLVEILCAPSCSGKKKKKRLQQITIWLMVKITSITIWLIENFLEGTR